MIEAPSVTALEVRVVSIDSFLRRRGIDRVDLVKLDTETTEPEALAGMGQTLARCTPDIICEVLPTADTDLLHKALKSYGYRFYLLTDTGPEHRSVISADPRWPNYLFTRKDLPSR